MARQIRLNAFHTNSPSHSWPGLWRHPSDKGLHYNSLSYWTDLAKLLEKGRFDALFLADTLGIHDVYGYSPDSALRNAVQVPKGEPTVLVSAMAAVTEHLGFGVTANVSFEPPFLHARRYSTLDHLTGGRIGWNVVTGHQESGARNLGQATQLDHNDRYELAEEYMEVAYKLWEGSWQDDAVLRDVENGIFADPERIHEIHHKGRYFSLNGIHLSEPSPQRTPLLFQAGSSEKGLDFASRHAESVFIAGSGRERLRSVVSDLRARAAASGRNPQDIQVIASATVIVAATREDAVERFESYRRHVSDEGMLTLISGWTGVDFSSWDPETPIKDIQTNAIQSTLKAMIARDPDGVWRLRDLGQFSLDNGRGIFIVDSGEKAAEKLIELADYTGLDGFNLIRVVHPETLEGIVEHLVPALQSRGAFKTEYAPGTLREKLFGQGRARLPQSHPAANWRVHATSVRSAAQ